MSADQALVKERFRMNPVLAKEIRERVRSPRAMVIIVVFLALMAALQYATYSFSTHEQRSFQGGFGFSSFQGARLGRMMFELLLMFLLGLVALITPSIAAGSIVGERERRTLHLLQVTLLRPRSIVLGKLGASLAFTLLLVVASIPLFSIPLVLGGVTIWQVLRGFFLLLCISLLLSAMGIYVSSIARRQQFAVIATFLLVAFYSVGTLVAFAGETFYWEVVQRGQRPPSVTVYFNPMISMASAVASGSNTSGSPLTEIAQSVNSVTRGRFLTSATPAVTPTSFFQKLRGTLWLIHAFIALATSALFIFLASHRLRAPAPRFSLGRPG